MSTIVTRLVKGSALTHTEMDSNFNNLNTDKLQSVQSDTAPSLGGDLAGGNFVVDNVKLQNYKEVIYSLGNNDSPVLTASNGNVQTSTITSNLNLSNFTDETAGQSLTILVTGNGTCTGSGSFKFANAGANTLTNLSVVSIFFDGTIYWVSIATDFV